MDLETLKAFEDEVRKIIPKFEVRFKNRSLAQKIVGFLSYPFNRDYMTKYTTTAYPYVYFPSEERYLTQPSSLTTLAHEFVHLVDMGKHPFWMRFSYGLPQVLCLLPLVAYGIVAREQAWVLAVALASYLLGCLVARWSIALFWIVALGGLITASVFSVLTVGWYSALLFGGLALAAPWPSPWRTRWEMRGYAMNLAVMHWTLGMMPELLKQSVLRKFVTSSYYFMSWSVDSTYDTISSIVTDVQSGELQRQYPYSVVHSFYASRGLLRK